MEQILETVQNAINEIKQINGKDKIEVSIDNSIISDLGFTSLDVAQLIAMLEIAFEKDPFAQGALLSDIRTVEDLCKLYV